MDEFTALINQIKSDPESMRQIRDMASSLGINTPPPAQASAQTQQAMPDLSALSSLLGNLGANQQQQPQTQQAMPDLSALSGLLGNLGANQQQQPQPQQAMPDLSALSGLLGNLGINPQPQQQPQAPASNLSALTALLGGANPSAPAGGILPNIDINMISKLSSALSSMQSNRESVNLLLALKPRLKDERAKKVDDAIRVMQLIQFLPLIKESGLFGEMDNMLGGIMGAGGLGGLLGNAGSSGAGLLNGLLGGLGRR